MATRHDTMMTPRIEELLDRASFKFSLVTLGARGRGRSTPTSASWARGWARSSRPRSRQWPASHCRSPSRRSPRERSRRRASAGTTEPTEGATEKPSRRRWPTCRVRRRPPPAGHRVVLGVSGGIAAYKAVDVCRRLVDAGAHVVPVLTEAALRFVGRTTFDALASERAHVSLWDDPHPIRTPGSARAPTSWVAPATAKVIDEYAGGYQRGSPDQRCWPPGRRWWSARPCTPRCGSTRRCRTTCTRWPAGGWSWSPEAGRLAGGDFGPGRLADPAVIVAAVEQVLTPADLAGLRCSSPPVAPGSRSTRCGSSPTGRRASRATPSPTKPPPGGPK